MDVHNAFLLRDLEEEVYMKLPPWFTNSDPNKVCRLRKSLYGLRQAPRCWFAKLSQALIKFGFTQSYSDYSLFSYTKDDCEIKVLVYVDDLVIASNDLPRLIKFKAYLSQCFRMKDLGKLKYFLGIEVARSEEGIFLSQRKYILDIVAETGLLGCKPTSTPMEQNHQLAADDGPLFADPSQYRRLVGRLVYLSISRPELCYSIHLLSQIMQNLVKLIGLLLFELFAFLKDHQIKVFFFASMPHLIYQFIVMQTGPLVLLLADHLAPAW